MNEQEKAKLIAEAENKEAIQDFLQEWWSVADLYETAAKATNALMLAVQNPALDRDQRQDVQNLMEQHLMMIDLIKPFEKKDAE